MKLELVAAATVVLLTSIGLGYLYSNKTKGGFQDRKLLKRGLDTPTIWVFVDSSEVNSRSWSDFGARSSRAINVPLLNLCYESIVKAAGLKYHIEIISGLQGVAERLGGWDAIPFAMRNKLLPLRTEEMTFIRTAILAKFGGLWMPISTVCLKRIPDLPVDKVAFFGTDPSETYSGPSGTLVPNTHIMWSPVPNHPIFERWSQALYSRIDEDQGGREVRNDASWDWTYATSGMKDQYVVYPYGELTRKKGGRRIELEDLFAAGTEGDIPFELRNESIFLAIPWKELKERRVFGWVLRSNEEQLMESDIALKYLL